MKDNLQIHRSIINDRVVLTIAGRIDANWSGQLETALNDEMREENYTIELNLRGVSYISSAGIGILVKYYKLLKNVHGCLYVSDASENVRSVLSLVGLSEIFKPIDGTNPDAKQSDSLNEKTETLNDVKYFIQRLHAKKDLCCYLSGNPDLLYQSGFSEVNARSDKLAENKYGIGMGAIGNSFHDCENRFGEFAEFGNIIAYLPGEQNNKPDYAVKTGNYVPEITSLYSVFFEGDFSFLIRFETEKNRLSVALSELIENYLSLTGINNAGLVILAETSGLIGASINASPLQNKQGSLLFKYPEIKEQITFTTESAYDKTLALITGIAVKEKTGLLLPFTRPLSSASNTRSHFHAVVFPHRFLKKNNINLKETAQTLFESEQLINILHLMNDDRESGIGESEFIKGYCWLGSIDSVSKRKEGSV